MAASSRRTEVVEFLESRRFFSAVLHAGDVIVNPLIAQGNPLVSQGTVVDVSTDGYTPAEIRKAYGFDKLNFADASGNKVAADGTGQTTAIVVAYDAPTAQADLDVFSQAYGLPSTTITKLNQKGATDKLPKPDEGWASEAALDVQWAHAMAPGAKIVLVEADSASIKDLVAAVDVARHIPTVSVVSMSWGGSEFAGETQYDQYFTTPAGHAPITFVAASGDEGSSGGALWPSVSSNVVAVGGTTLLTSDTAGTYYGEYAWSGSGGGSSRYEKAPAYQASVLAASATTQAVYGGNYFSPAFARGGRRSIPTRATTVAPTTRTAPDVSYNANPQTGFMVYDSYGASSADDAWQIVGGTSAGAPQWAAIFAIANQGRGLSGQATLDTNAALTTLYTLAAGTSYATAFNDVTVGRSGFFTSAGVGYDKVSGLGSPEVDQVVGFLIAPPATTAATTAATATTAKPTRTAAVQASKVAARTLTVAPASPEFSGTIVVVPAVPFSRAPLPAGGDTVPSAAAPHVTLAPLAAGQQGRVAIENIGPASAEGAGTSASLDVAVAMAERANRLADLWALPTGDSVSHAEAGAASPLVADADENLLATSALHPFAIPEAEPSSMPFSLDFQSAVTEVPPTYYLVAAAIFSCVLVQPGERQAVPERRPRRSRVWMSPM